MMDDIACKYMQTDIYIKKTQQERCKEALRNLGIALAGQQN